MGHWVDWRLASGVWVFGVVGLTLLEYRPEVNDEAAVSSRSSVGSFITSTFHTSLDNLDTLELISIQFVQKGCRRYRDIEDF